MKKTLALLLVLALGSIQFAYATDTTAPLNTANIKIKVSGATQDNRYFLCLPNIGCLSILAAQKGKVYPVIHSFRMDNIFVTNLQDFRLFNEGLPDSCNVTVNTDQTITIYGNITKGPNNSIHLNNLRCSVA